MANQHRGSDRRWRRLMKWVAIAASAGIVAAMLPVVALERSVGIGGIEARMLHEAPYNLLGRKVAIGQVEIGRPAVFGLDKAALRVPTLSIGGVFHRERPARANRLVDAHANMVATVMVSRDKRLRGVAPEARLYAGAVGSLRGAGQPEECLVTQHVALQNGGDVRGINFSFGESLQRDVRDDASLDGNALLTRCVDWSARVHDVLYVIAGNQGGGGIPIPTDNYNGINVAYATQRNGRFSKVDFANLSAQPTGIGRRLIARELNVGTRRSINLVAPGDKITLVNLRGRTIRASGTSFAAPHVTASVALLQEYGDRLLAGSNPNERWSLDARRHEVMKAVFLNAAEKIHDSGNGMRLGMGRTILTKDNRTWLDSDAYSNPATPLNYQLGTGYFNVFRAYEQFATGEQGHQTPVPFRGWDYDRVAVDGQKDYELAQPLVKDSFVSITLAWDRLVELDDANRNLRYEVGETFRDRGLNDLNLYLVALDGLPRVACASTSVADSVEHIFCPVPESGRYKIQVRFEKQVNEPTQAYGLAWWSVPQGFESGK